jgi:hypothetical protein
MSDQRSDIPPISGLSAGHPSGTREDQKVNPIAPSRETGYRPCSGRTAEQSHPLDPIDQSLERWHERSGLHFM